MILRFQSSPVPRLLLRAMRDAAKPTQLKTIDSGIKAQHNVYSALLMVLPSRRSVNQQGMV